MTKNILRIILPIIIISGLIILYFIKIRANCNDEILDIALVNKEYETIIRCANKDIPKAMTMLGVLYVRGEGVPQDRKEAMNFYQKASNKGDSLAMIKIGDLYATGGPRDYNQAILWYQKAVDKNDINALEAMYNLSIAYSNKSLSSEDEINDRNSGIEWLQKAANNGHIEAMKSLARDYKIGYKFKVDYSKTMEWYQKAAALGDPSSHIRIGDLYANGFGVPQSYEQAHLWYQKAADLGDTEAIELIKPNPSPFGLELTKATIDDFKKLFPNHKKHSGNIISGKSTVFHVKPENLRLDGVIDEVIFVFNDNKVLDAVLIGMKHSKFEEIKNSLNSKYGIPKTDGWYNVGQSVVRLCDYRTHFSYHLTDSRGMDSSITLTYKTNTFDNLISKYNDKKDKEKELHKKNQGSLL